MSYIKFNVPEEAFVVHHATDKVTLFKLKDYNNDYNEAKDAAQKFMTDEGINERDMVTKISESLKAFNMTEEGKLIKKEAHKKRSETMKRQKQERMENITEKKCTKCDIVKPINKFYTRKDSKDGYFRICIECYQASKKK